MAFWVSDSPPYTFHAFLGKMKSLTGCYSSNKATGRSSPMLPSWSQTGLPSVSGPCLWSQLTEGNLETGFMNITPCHPGGSISTLVKLVSASLLFMFVSDLGTFLVANC